MKKFITLLLITFSFLCQAQIVNIPDANFKTALLNYSPTIDTNGDSEIQVSEALAVTSLDLRWNSISDLTGLNSFVNLQNFTFSSGSTLNLDLTALSNLLSLDISNSYIVNSINVSGLTSLQSLNCSGCYQITSLNVSGLTNLQTLNCSNCYQITSLDVSGLTSLQSLNCSDCNRLASLNVSGLTSLQSLNCSDCNQLTSLNVSGLTNLQSLNCSDANLATLDFSGSNNITNLNCSSNHLTSLNVLNLPNLQALNCSNQTNYSFSTGLTTLDLTGLTQLTSLSCHENSLTSLNINHLANLTILSCGRNQLTTLNVSNLTNLTYLDCGYNQLTTIDVSNLVNLRQFSCYVNQLTSLNVNNLTQLTHLYCAYNPINNLDVSNLVNLTSLYCGDNHLSTLNVSNNVNLQTLNCETNQLTNLDLHNLTNLTDIRCESNLFTTLDLSTTGTNQTNNQFQNLQLGNNPNLVYLNLKNGVCTYFNSSFADNCPNLRYICADDCNIQSVISGLNPSWSGSTTNPALVQVNSYCSFTPGGVHNTITGAITLDLNNNGCTALDPHFPAIRVNINDGTNTGATYCNSTGNYSFYTLAGNFVITPQLQNSFFTISPATATLNFPTNNNSTQTQDFCITPVGIHNDLDITLMPLGGARPGFDANYQIVYKNKGNQTLSGNINLSFDDAVLDFVSANPTINSQTINNLNWNYSNLLPFESRTINFTLNVNSPMETPPVNIGDHLNFTATINPISGDETTEDNISELGQIVVGSFDPNDKICLEGDSIVPARVGEYLHYVIRFQNSGTAPAENIVVKDMIDTSKFDINSLQLTNSAHTQTTKITENKVEFIFENINLPAESVNEPGSHGFVAFKIKTKNNLVLGDTVSNTANIFFDYNFPIVTNTATTTIANLLGIEGFENTSVSVFPNPVKDKLSITSIGNITSIQLFDVQGRLIETSMKDSESAIFDLSEKQSGVYLIKIVTEKGIKIQKIVKE